MEIIRYGNLSPLERDLLGVLAREAHELWEVYRFVRRHHPEASDPQIRRIGNELLAQWVSRGWITAFRSKKDRRPLSREELLAGINSLGMSALEPEKATLILVLSAQAPDLRSTDNGLNMADEIIIRKSLDGRIIHWSENAERAFGYTSGEALGRHVSMIIPFDWQDEEYQMLDELRAGQTVNQRKTVRRSKDGRYWEVDICISPIRDENEKIVGAEKRYFNLRPYISRKLAKKEQGSPPG